ncbi:hypothetical protein HDU96_000770, partial [Phlyctochytrium bullatum]
MPSILSLPRELLSNILRLADDILTALSVELLAIGHPALCNPEPYRLRADGDSEEISPAVIAIWRSLPAEDFPATSHLASSSARIPFPLPPHLTAFLARFHPRLIATAASTSRIAATGQTNLLALIHTLSPFPHPFPSSAIVSAADAGHLPTVRFLHSAATHAATLVPTAAMDAAAAAGHLPVVTFLHTHRPEGCTWRAQARAIANGHVAVAQFLATHRSEGFLAPGTTSDTEPPCIIDAAARGFLPALQFARETLGSTVGVRARAAAMEHGRDDIVAYCFAHGLGGSVTQREVVTACALGAVERLFGWSTGQENLWTEPICWRKMAEAGHVDVMRWLVTRVELGDVVWPAVWEAAVANGEEGVVRWVCGETGPRREMWDSKWGNLSTYLATLIAAGHVGILRYLHTRFAPLPFPPAPMLLALLSGQLAAFRFLHDEAGISVPADLGSLLSLDPRQLIDAPHVVLHLLEIGVRLNGSVLRSAMVAAVRQEAKEMVTALWEYCWRDGVEVGCQALDAAADIGNLALVELLHCYSLWSLHPTTPDVVVVSTPAGPPHPHTQPLLWASTLAMDKAAAHGHFPVLEFLAYHRNEGFSVAAIDDAANANQVEIIRFLLALPSGPHVPSLRFSEDAVLRAAQRGHVEALTLLLDAAARDPHTLEVVRRAAPQA